MPRLTERQLTLGGMAVLAVWVLVILPLLYYPRQETPKSYPGTTQNQQEADRIGEEAPTLIELKPFKSAGRNEIAKYCAPKTQDEKNKWAHSYICDVKITDAYLAFFNFLLVVVTGGLIAVGYLTIRKMRDTEQRQLRAYMDVRPRKVERTEIGVVAHVILVNAGRVPARRVGNNLKICWSDDGDKKDFEEVEIENRDALLIVPGAEIVGGSKPLKKEDADKFDARDGYVYVWGVVEYSDGFRHRRWLKFCHRYNCAKPEELRRHHHHNDGN
jgi:hypothetical protein